MRVILGVSIFILACWIGIKASNKLKDKLHFAQDFWAFLDRMNNNISFEQKSVTQVVDEQKKVARPSFCKFLQNRAVYSQSDEATALANSFFDNFGHRDKETELSYIAQTKAALTPVLAKCEENQKKGYLITKLSTLVGLALCIIVI